MKLQRIRYFVTLARTLSFSRTAQIHYVSQTTVSQQIRALETELGQELFARTKRKVELTAAGTVFLEEAQKALEILDRADEKMRLFKAEELLPLKVGLVGGVTPGYAAPLLQGFKDQNPDVVLECAYCAVGDLYPNVVAGSTDVGLILDVGPFRRDGARDDALAKVVVDRLDQYVVVSNRSHLAQCGRISRDQLAGERFVNTLAALDFIPQRVCDGPDGEEAPAQGAVYTDVVVESMDGLLLSLSLGDGYTLLAAPLVQTIEPGLTLAAIPVAGEKVPLVACYRAGTANEAARRFVAYLEER